MFDQISEQRGLAKLTHEINHHMLLDFLSHQFYIIAFLIYFFLYFLKRDFHITDWVFVFNF